MANIGIDILEVERFNQINTDEEKMKKIFTDSEIKYFNKFSEKLSHIAGHFCAKEAVAKALKKGFGEYLSPVDVEVLHNKDGAPYVNINNPKLQKVLCDRKIDISISHTKLVATAICIVE